MEKKMTQGAYGYIKDDRLFITRIDSNAIPNDFSYWVFTLFKAGDELSLWGKIIDQIIDGTLTAEDYSNYTIPRYSGDCEYTYLFNFDNKTFEFYVGNQKKPHSDGRFVVDANRMYGGYYPSRLALTMTFSEIERYPTDTLVQQLRKAESHLNA